MKIKISLLALAIFIFAACQPNKKENDKAGQAQTQKKLNTMNVHDFTVNNIQGKEVSLSKYKGKKIMIVNTASECGLTPQYKQLEELYQFYKNQNFVILGFPANNFGNQEPGSDQEIAKFCKTNYGVTFPMMAKISVKGNTMHPLYAFLTKKENNGLLDAEVEWNFQKFLINKKGELEKVIQPQTLPNDSEVIDWIEKS